MGLRTRLLALLLSAVGATPVAASEPACGGFIDWVADSVDRYQELHRVHPVDDALRALAVRFQPRLWVSPGSYRPVDFDAYLASATLYALEDDRVLAAPPATAATMTLSRAEQCRAYLDAPEVLPASPAPVYVQVFRDAGPDGSQGWLYFKYTVVFDWSGLAQERGFVSRVGSTLTGGAADRWHRLDVHTSAIVGVDAERRLRTLTLQQHNNKRTYVAGLDFDASKPVHVAAARQTNELYLDAGSGERQRRRAVPSFMQWKHLVSADHGTWLWQVDEFLGRNAGGEEVPLRAVFPAPDYPLAAFAGLLAPPQRLLGLYVGRDGPPGYDFTGSPEMPHAAALGFWQEDDAEFLEVLDAHVEGFRSTNWEAIRKFLSGRLVEALTQRAAQRVPVPPSPGLP